MDRLPPPEQHELLPAPQPIEALPSGIILKKKSKIGKILLWGGLGIFIVLLSVSVASWLWYQAQLAPVDASATADKVKVTIEPNTSPNQIATLLEEENLIRNARAFSLYTRFSGTQNLLQAGSYRLSPSESVEQIVEHLTKGNIDTFDITFLPGATLAENREVLIEAGYSATEVDAALNKTYDLALFNEKPAPNDLEGYIYGETYRLGSDATVEDILGSAFAEFNKVITDNDLEAKYAAQGLSLFEGITLASIIQRESVGGDEAQIAQVFYKRLAEGMELGSDVTYQYIADKTGVPRDTNLDSPYNTRRYAGLPPGPISAPGLASLLAVGSPAEGDYLYFLSGDDDITYFARNYAGHEANILAHCRIKCSII